MDEEMSLLELIGIVKKRLGLIMLGILTGMLLLAGYSFYVSTPQYSSTTQLVVNRSQDTEVIQRTDIETNVQLINTYKDLLRSPAILDEVIEELNLPITSQQLLNQLNVTSENNSQVFSIQIINPNPNNAAIIANKTAEIFQEKLEDIMSLDNVTIFSQASVNPNPVSPNHTLNLLIGFVLGGVLATSLAIFIEFKDTTVKDESFITEHLGLINLGCVSEMLPEKISDKNQQVVPERLPDSVSARTKV